MMKNKNCNKYVKSSAAFLLLTLLVTATIGCSTRSSVVREETVTTVDYPRAEYANNNDNSQQTEVVTKTSSESSESADHTCSGVLSCIVHAAGKVIVFPFVVLGEIFDTLF